MPIYDFVCNSCGRRFECLVRIGREQDASCPHCCGTDVRKVPSTFGIGGGNNRLSSSSNACSTCSGKSCSTCK